MQRPIVLMRALAHSTTRTVPSVSSVFCWSV